MKVGSRRLITADKENVGQWFMVMDDIYVGEYIILGGGNSEIEAIAKRIPTRNEMHSLCMRFIHYAQGFDQIEDT